MTLIIPSIEYLIGNWGGSFSKKPGQKETLTKPLILFVFLFSFYPLKSRKISRYRAVRLPSCDRPKHGCGVVYLSFLLTDFFSPVGPAKRTLKGQRIDGSDFLSVIRPHTEGRKKYNLGF